jgi:hypothetical protein
LLVILKRSTSHKGKTPLAQTRIDTGSWTAKSKTGKIAIDKAWVNNFHIEIILGVKVDNSYFVIACKETKME